MKLNQSSNGKVLDLIEAGVKRSLKAIFALFAACLAVYFVAVIYVGIFELPNRYERAKQQYFEYQEKANIVKANSSFSPNE